jgi:isopenicillin-N N-acyltransferase like protein
MKTETRSRIVQGGFLCLAVVGILTPKLEGCTLWGAAGSSASGGTIISKNRDEKPDHTQVLKMHRNGKGYAYFALYAEGGSDPGIKQGVNEKGLAVVTASASCIPKKVRDSQEGKHGSTATLLSTCADCDEVLAKKDSIFPNVKTVFLMISDGRKILMVEVGLDGRFTIETVESGTVVHTNHFLQKPLEEFNLKIGPSSAARFERITQLMKVAPKPCGTDSFAKISRDQHDGPDNSLWRSGKREQTLSSWILETPAHGAPRLRVVVENPGLPEETKLLVLDQKFWKEAK